MGAELTVEVAGVQQAGVGTIEDLSPLNCDWSDFTWSSGSNIAVRHGRSLDCDGTTMIALVKDGSNNIARRTTDGLTWYDTVVFVDSTTQQSLAYGNGVWIIYEALAEDAYTSADGISWTYHDLSALTLTSGDAHVVFAHDRFFLVPNDGNSNCLLYTSTDAVNWTLCNQPSTSRDMREMVWTGTHYVSVGDLQWCWRSTDGINFAEVQILAGEFGLSQLDTPIAYGNGKVVVVGNPRDDGHPAEDQTILLTSDDSGLTWSYSIFSSSKLECYYIRYFDKRFVFGPYEIAGSGTGQFDINSSVDLSLWAGCAVGGQFDVSYLPAHKRWVSVGWNGVSQIHYRVLTEV